MRQEPWNTFDLCHHLVEHVFGAHIEGDEAEEVGVNV